MIEHPWQLPSSKQPLLSPHPFVAAFGSSLVLGVGLGLLSWWCTKKYLEKQRTEELPSKTQQHQTNGQSVSKADSSENLSSNQITVQEKTHQP